MVRKQFLTNHDSAHVHNGILDYVKVNITEEATTNSMNEINSFSQILFFILFQVAFRLIGEPFDFFTKVFLFILVDLLMVLIVVSEWFNSKVEWQTWLLKVFV